MIFEDLQIIDYRQAWDYQTKIQQEIIEAKVQTGLRPVSSITPQNHLLFCEHPHVYTLGKSGKQNNLLISDDFLKQINATYYKIDRGGDITYHGPGQLVAYPIFDLDTFNIGVRKYVNLLEEAVILTLKEFGISSGRSEGATGVWLNDEKGERKICAIGIKASRNVTMHGLALNVNTDMQYFNYINPCGFIEKGVTSISLELSKTIELNIVKDVLKKNLFDIFV